LFADSMRRLRLLPLAALVPLVAAAAPADAPEHVKYRVELYGPGGLHVVTSRTEIDDTGSAYTIRSSIETRGLAGWFVTIKGSSEAHGRLTAEGAQPERYRSDTVRNGTERINRVTYAEAGAVSGSSTPPPKERVKPVMPAQTHGTVDNLTAYFLLERRLGHGGDCNLTVPVFDGQQRYDLKFTDAGQQKLSPRHDQNFAGMTTVCRMQRIEIAGFPEKAEDREGARSGTLWYARLVPGDLVQAVRMDMETEAGAISGYLAEVEANGHDLKLME
jgi:hypothetical protein